MICMIVAMDKHGLIGKNNHLPWHCPQDLKHFYATVKNHELLMGKHTFDSIRMKDNIVHVATHQRLTASEKIRPCKELISFLKEWKKKDDVLFVCGGASIYAQAFAYCDEAYVSIIEGEYEGDCYLKEIDFSVFSHCEVMQREGFVLYHYKDRR